MTFNRLLWTMSLQVDNAVGSVFHLLKRPGKRWKDVLGPTVLRLRNAELGVLLFVVVVLCFVLRQDFALSLRLEGSGVICAHCNLHLPIQAILLAQLPEQLGLQAHATTPS